MKYWYHIIVISVCVCGLAVLYATHTHTNEKKPDIGADRLNEAHTIVIAPSRESEEWVAENEVVPDHQAESLRMKRIVQESHDKRIQNGNMQTIMSLTKKPERIGNEPDARAFSDEAVHSTHVMTGTPPHTVVVEVTPDSVIQLEGVKNK